MDLVVLTQDKAAQEDHHVAGAGQDGHQPHAHAEDEAFQKVLPAGDAVTAGLTLHSMLCIHTLVELVEVASITTTRSKNVFSKLDIFYIYTIYNSFDVTNKKKRIVNLHAYFKRRMSST